MNSRPQHAESIGRPEFLRVAKASAIFFLCWSAGFVVSYLWANSGLRLPDGFLFRFFDNQMWFYPQEVLPHGLQTVDKWGVCYEIVSTPVTMILGVLFWLFVGVTFAWLSRRLHLYVAAPLAIIAIFVALFAAQAFLALFNVEIPVVGP